MNIWFDEHPLGERLEDLIVAKQGNSQRFAPGDGATGNDASDHELEVDQARVALGRRVRALRGERGISGRALASQIGVTSGFISQLEAGTVSPSVATLVKLAAVLDVGVGDLFGVARPMGRVLRKDERVGYSYPDSGFTEERLCSDPRLEVIHAIVEPGAVSGPGLVGGAELEFAFVLSGEVVMDLNGEQYELAVGDVITFAGSVPQGMRNPSRRAAAEVIWASVPSHA